MRTIVIDPVLHYFHRRENSSTCWYRIIVRHILYLPPGGICTLLELLHETPNHTVWFDILVGSMLRSPFDGFWAHPVWSAYSGLSFSSLMVQLSTTAEIS